MSFHNTGGRPKHQDLPQNELPAVGAGDGQVALALASRSIDARRVKSHFIKSAKRFIMMQFLDIFHSIMP